MSPTVIVFVFVAVCDVTLGYHMQGWHHDLAEKKKQPVAHPAFDQLQSINRALTNADPAQGVVLPPNYHGRATAATDEIRSEAGRSGFARHDLLANQLRSDDYNHKGYARGGTQIETMGSALLGGPFSQGSKGQSFRVRSDSGSRVTQGIQRSDEAARDYEAELNRDYLRSRTAQLSDLGVLDSESAGVLVDWKHAGIDNVAVKSNQVSAVNRAKGKTVDVVDDREYGAGNAESARIVSVAA